jgi:hypothetical protein
VQWSNVTLTARRPYAVSRQSKRRQIAYYGQIAGLPQIEHEQIERWFLAFGFRVVVSQLPVPSFGCMCLQLLGPLDDDNQQSVFLGYRSEAL